MNFACIIPLTAKLGSNTRREILAKTIQVPDEVQEIIRSIQVGGFHLRVPDALQGSEVKAARKQLRRSANGMPNTFELELPNLVRNAAHGGGGSTERLARARGRWSTSVLIAALDHFDAMADPRDLTIIFPDDQPALRLTPVADGIQIQQL